MKEYRQFILEILSAINIKNPDIQQKMKDAMANHDSATVLSLFKQYAGKAKPAKFKDGDTYFDYFGHSKKPKHLGPASLDKVNKKHKKVA